MMPQTMAGAAPIHTLDGQNNALLHPRARCFQLTLTRGPLLGVEMQAATRLPQAHHGRHQCPRCSPFLAAIDRGRLCWS